jgi:uncharacterized damage-inducible protein DinB
MVAFFKELFEYNNHYNQKLYTAFVEHEGILSEKSFKLYSHILNAHHIWNHRIELKKPILTPWDLQPLSACKDLDNNNFQNTLLILDQYNLDQMVKYTTSKGDPFEHTIKELLFHVINHSTYHRAQIATEFKQAGIEPIVTDYIYYKR